MIVLVRTMASLEELAAKVDVKLEICCQLGSSASHPSGVKEFLVKRIWRPEGTGPGEEGS